MRGLVKLSVRTLTLLALPLCAGCMSVYVVGPDPMECTKTVPRRMQEPTPHTTPPVDDKSKEWVGFGVREAGQLEISNTDKTTGWDICREVERQNALARENARAKIEKKWWQIWK